VENALAIVYVSLIFSIERRSWSKIIWREGATEGRSSRGKEQQREGAAEGRNKLASSLRGAFSSSLFAPTTTPGLSYTFSMSEQPDQLPINWPDNVEYLRQLRVSPAVPASVLKLLNTPTRATATHPRLSIDAMPFPSPKVRITRINDAEHPANGQAGLAALTPLHPGTFIIPYIGRLHTNDKKDTDHTSEYDISLDRDLGVALDSAKSGNEARFINDYRGIADRPNAEFRDIWVQVADRTWERWIGIFVVTVGKAGQRKQGIRPGEEILVSYGKAFWTDRQARLDEMADP
jgi:hypothetical protein